mmetsp:Transcript_22217/g.30562  ORF Transcript_22217/g.30562 Transcript_22217/m.30562 type:complete len:214 (+) Transcript_22217:238-879(+)|eukprot:CAMPEP_0201492844 /NCGR_PEP_ID=MMETSP0151_2-20130828/34945_1 /ASSEMBLY_ACC=CAM_ASM_000257 /TAXON_ID=200890 /ORGANISM="Paramoeba atlantica, Strain 621/1 / CCAP 1560/9" /LENGTH=213 /DNA_ID=CAMNT_0047879881 /DNA_START=228 /DNA_END=872 /DNA_ORIENTATION=-
MADPIAMDPGYDFLFKILLIGDMNVGKRQMLINFAKDEGAPPGQHDPLDFKVQTYEVDNHTIKVQLWGTGGQEKYRTVTESYYRGAHGILVVYDITDRESFENARMWFREVKAYGSDEMISLLVGNKLDLKDNRQVQYDEAISLQKEFEEEYSCIGYVETSVITGENLDDMYRSFARSILQAQKNPGQKNGSFQLGANEMIIPPKKKSRCALL